MSIEAYRQKKSFDGRSPQDGPKMECGHIFHRRHVEASLEIEYCRCKCAELNRACQIFPDRIFQQVWVRLQRHEMILCATRGADFSETPGQVWRTQTQIESQRTPSLLDGKSCRGRSRRVSTRSQTWQKNPKKESCREVNVPETSPAHIPTLCILALRRDTTPTKTKVNKTVFLIAILSHP